MTQTTIKPEIILLSDVLFIISLGEVLKRMLTEVICKDDFPYYYHRN